MYELNVIKSTINIGIEKPIKFLHITDTHIALDDPEKISGRAAGCFEGDEEGKTIELLKMALAYAKENNLPIVHTGDLIDFFSRATFNVVDELFTKDIDYIYAAGNHDFCHFVGEAREDYEYKWEKINDIAPHIKSNLYFDSKIIGGVNFVSLDDSYYQITMGQIESLKAEVAKGYPIVLCMHVPIYSPNLAQAAIPEWCPNVSFLMGVPEKVLSKYPEDRRIQQTPDETTKKAIDYIKNEPLIKALITGHNHINHEEEIIKDKMQFTTHGTFAGFVREITVI